MAKNCGERPKKKGGGLGNALAAEGALKAAKITAKQALPTIIEAIVKEAKGGSCQHAKFLMEFLNDEPTNIVSEDEGEEESLAALLLKELQDDRAALEGAG